MREIIADGGRRPERGASAPGPRSSADPALTRAAARQRRIVASLAARLRGELIETHISWVVLAGDRAYKFKKVLRNAWLDYGDTAARRRCCEEELRLNARLADGLYLGVSVVTGSARRPVLDGVGPVLDYAVRMRRFDQRALWTWRLAHGQLGSPELSRFGVLLADVHAGAARAAAAQPWGGAAAVAARTDADIAEVGALLAPDSRAGGMLTALAAWLRAQQGRLAGRFERRRAAGWVRECHGDLHCGNILTLEGRVLAFDGVEFNAGLRWTDVQQDVAFICMDLQCGGRDDLAARLLDAYLQRGGDYDGLPLLPYYRCQRALVRAKVALLRDGRDGAGLAEAERYLATALRASAPATPLLLATCGLSGSGKSTVCDSLVEPLAAVRLRSDVERKRMHGLGAGDPAPAAPGTGIYTGRAARLTYAMLMRLACRVAASGTPVLLDAAFLLRWQRQRVTRLARRIRARCLMLTVTAAPPIMAQRLAARKDEPGQPSDAGVELMAHQLRLLEPLLADERADSLAVDTDEGWSAARASALAAAIRRRLAG